MVDMNDIYIQTDTLVWSSCFDECVFAYMLIALAESMISSSVP
jgi:hypothetical protein